MLQSRDVCFVHLGKFGDIILMLPAFKAVADELGKPPICVVSKDYASLFDGVSYVQPWVVPLHWWRGVGEARKMVESHGANPIVVKWWDEPGAKPPGILNTDNHVTLNIHGVMKQVSASEWDSYQTSQWRAAGFTAEQMMKLPLVFDRRNPGREAALRQKYFKTNQPKLLVNLSTSGASPFRHGHLIWAYVQGLGFEVIDLAGVTAQYIFDLLGLFDHAAAMITSDTSTLHLAAASPIPYIAFVNDGGAGSVPKGNCVLQIRYAQATKQRTQILNVLNRLKK